MPTFTHSGLYFTDQHIQTARKHRDQEPFTAAWALLNDSAPADSLTAALWNGFRYRLDDNAGAAQNAIITLQSGAGLDGADFKAVEHAITLAHSYELIRDYFPRDTEHIWRERFAAQVVHLNSQLQFNFVEHLWLGLLNVVAGIALEDETRFESGVETFQQTIQNEIRPEGYLPRAVEGGDDGSLTRQLLSVGALVLMAEAAAHVGVDLWSYTSRGISVTTAAAYCIYYYYYPDKWRWGSITQAVPPYHDYGAFLEIVNLRAHPKDLKLLLDERRPFFSPVGGGLTTLTHGLPPRRRLFG